MSIGIGGNNPMEYLKKYAKVNNMNLNDAMGALQSKYGDPNASKLKDTSIFDMAGQSNMTSMPDFMNKFDGPQKPGDPDPEMKGAMGGNNVMQSIMNFFKGGSGPLQEGDPQFGMKGTKELQFIMPGDAQGVQGQQQGMDPDAYAQQYADQKGISLDEAKEELKSKYGDPRKQQQQ